MMHGLGPRATVTVLDLGCLSSIPICGGVPCSTLCLSLLRHFHSVHICSPPAGSSSQGLSAIGEIGERSESLSSHIATLILTGVDVGRGSKPNFQFQNGLFQKLMACPLKMIWDSKKFHAHSAVGIPPKFNSFSVARMKQTKEFPKILAKICMTGGQGGGIYFWNSK